MSDRLQFEVERRISATRKLRHAQRALKEIESVLDGDPLTPNKLDSIREIVKAHEEGREK